MRADSASLSFIIVKYISLKCRTKTREQNVMIQVQDADLKDNSLMPCICVYDCCVSCVNCSCISSCLAKFTSQWWLTSSQLQYSVKHSTAFQELNCACSGSPLGVVVMMIFIIQLGLFMASGKVQPFRMPCRRASSQVRGVALGLVSALLFACFFSVV